MFSSLSTLSSSAHTNSSSASSASAEISSAVQSQSFEEKIPLASKEEIEKKLASILTQVQQNQIKRLDLTSASLGRYYELANTFSGHKKAVCCLTVLQNSILASGSWDNTIKIWDVASRSCLSALVGHTDWVQALAVLPSGLLASGSWDNTIKIWDRSSSSCLSTLEGHTASVWALAVLPNGLLASGSWDKTIKVWDLASSSCLSTLQGHTHWVRALAVLPNGQLASGSADTTIKLWDLSSHSCLSTLYGHTDTVFALTVLPNGQVASGSADNSIKFWDMASCFCLSTLRGHADTVLALTILPNNKLVSGSAASTIKLWKPRTLSTKYLSSILNALRSNISVVDLDLSGNEDIRDDLVEPLISIFTPDTSSGSKPNSSLKTIDLRRTGVSKKGLKKLVKAIQHQRLSIEVLSDCPAEWMMIYFLIIFCRANRNSPFVDSGLDLCKHSELRPFLGVPFGFFTRFRKRFSSNSKYVDPSPSCIY